MQSDRTLKEIIGEVADEEGMSFDEVMTLFKQGLKDANGVNVKLTAKQKAKAKKKKKIAKASRKRNR